jgi:hypothetical protein
MATLAVLAVSKAVAALVIVMRKYSLVLGKECRIGVPAERRKKCAPESFDAANVRC